MLHLKILLLVHLESKEFFIIPLLPRLAPIGVCSLVAARIAAMDGILQAMGKLGLYIMTVLCGLLIHSLIVLPLVFFFVTRKNPYAFMKGLRDALMTAFSIASRFVTSNLHQLLTGLFLSTPRGA